MFWLVALTVSSSQSEISVTENLGWLLETIKKFAKLSQTPIFLRKFSAPKTRILGLRASIMFLFDL